MVNTLTSTSPSYTSGSPQRGLASGGHCHHRGHLPQPVSAGEPAPELWEGEKKTVEEGRDLARYPPH